MPITQYTRDVEAAGSSGRPLDGFPSLADFIASDADHTSLVFKRFDRLAARNLLYLQSELAVLQAKQDALDAEDRSIEHGDLLTKECAMNWEKFKASAENGTNLGQRKRMELALEIREKLKQYREALLFESTLAVLKPPPKRTFDAISHATRRYNKSEKRWDALLGGYSATLYSTNNDLVLLKQPDYEDRLTGFVHRYLSVLFVSGKRDGGTAYVPEQRIGRFVTIVSILVTVVLLFVAIVTLYAVASPKKKLAMVGIYMLLFAISVGLFTTAKRSEVFAATAAYAAVLVVFISGNLGSKKE